MEIKNLTPHAITIVGDGARTISPSGKVARVATSRMTLREDVDGIPVDVVTFGDVTDLPAPAEGVALIVSAMVRTALPGRLDVFSPGELVRDDAGNPIGCRGLVGNL